MNTERERIEEISSRSLYSAGIMPIAIKYCFSILTRHVRVGSILEMGPAEGVMTELLNTLPVSLTLVEGSSAFCEQLRRRFPTNEVVNCLFEDFSPGRSFDVVVLGHVLEHVEDPLRILSLVKSWLRPNGKVFAACPNSLSLHRQAAVLMGLLSRPDELNSLDLAHGHRRVFNPGSFRKLFEAAGFSLDIFGGYWLKPVSNRQLELTWTPEMINAYMRMGEEYPEIAAEIYVLASVSNP